MRPNPQASLPEGPREQPHPPSVKCRDLDQRQADAIALPGRFRWVGKIEHLKAAQLIEKINRRSVGLPDIRLLRGRRL